LDSYQQIIAHYQTVTAQEEYKIRCILKWLTLPNQVSSITLNRFYATYQEQGQESARDLILRLPPAFVTSPQGEVASQHPNYS